MTNLKPNNTKSHLKSQEFFQEDVISSEKLPQFPPEFTDHLENASYFNKKVLNYHLWVIKNSPYNFSEASVDRIATDLGCSERTVIRAMNYWRSKKVLITARRRYRCLKAKRGWASYTNMTRANKLLFGLKNLLLLASLYLPALGGMTFKKPTESWSVMSYKEQGCLFKYNYTSKYNSTRGTPSLRHGNFKTTKKGKYGAEPWQSRTESYRDRYRKSTFKPIGALLGGALSRKKEQTNEHSLVYCLSCDHPFEYARLGQCPACKAYGFYRKHDP